MSRKVIGLVGPISSGKSLVASYLKSLGYVYFSLSDIVRRETIKRGLELTRKNLQDIGNSLREEKGGQILAEMTLDLITDQELIVVDSIRNPQEIEFLKDNLEAKIIGITAPDELRLNWYLERAHERGEDGATVEDFNRANNRDLGIGEHSTGQQVERCLELSDFLVENLGSKEDILEKINIILESEINLSPEGNRLSKEKK